MLLPALFALTACTPADEVEDPEAHACEHVTEGGTAITAGADTASAPGISVGDEPYVVTLVDSAAGYLSIEIAEDTAALLFLGTANVAATLWHGEEDEGLPEPAPNERCAEDIPEHFDLDFHEAGTYYLELGPAAVPDVWLYLSIADGHAHEE